MRATLTIALIVVAASTRVWASPAESPQAGRAFSMCDPAPAAANPPGHALEALRRLLDRRVACQDEVMLSLETELQVLASEYGEQLQTTYLATEAMFALRSRVNTLQAVATGQESEGGTLETAVLEVFTAIEAVEETLNAVGDDAQLANVDLQNILQKQQQTLQMMSNISKMLYDSATSVFRKIGG
jgi:hypothetical protein